MHNCVNKLWMSGECAGMMQLGLRRTASQAMWLADFRDDIARVHPIPSMPRPAPTHITIEKTSLKPFSAGLVMVWLCRRTASNKEPPTVITGRTVFTMLLFKLERKVAMPTVTSTQDGFG